MKKLIILTGVSGTGKTSLAKHIQKELNNVTVITVDTILENICDMIGFKDKKQKNRIRLLARKFSKSILEECMKRNDEIIVIDYPFSRSWESYFKRISQKFEYDVLTCKMYGNTFEDIWNRVCIRDMSKERHVIHEIDSYDVKNKEKYQRGQQKKHILKRVYEEERRTTFVVGEELKIISDKDSAKIEAFDKIKTWIES